MSHEKLTLEQREALRQQSLTKHYTANILTHWFNVFMWVVLFTSGLGILLGKAYPFVPDAWNALMRNIFGGLAPMIEWHAFLGQVWFFVLVFNVLVGFRKYFIPFAATRMFMDRDDWKWLMIRPLQLFGLMKNKELPPQDAYNGGQKLYSYLVLVGTAGIGVTGLIMTYSELIPTTFQWVIQWAMPLHFLAVGGTFAGVIIHVYMGAIMPEEREAFFSMFSGKVNGLYAYLHHRKWYERKMAEKAAWEDYYNKQAEPEATPDVPAPNPTGGD
ncbi:MAG: cytochrome b/b6 domain-containing protein [Anaerolineae bacterium]